MNIEALYVFGNDFISSNFVDLNNQLIYDLPYRV
jgi:hypothetical protein